MSQQFLGQISLFGFPFAPNGWALCQGQLLNISQNTALFSLLGTYYGGDGRSTFGLPNLQGRIAVNAGQANGLSNYVLGQTGGAATVTLIASQLPAHTHALPATSARGTQATPAASSGLAATLRGTSPYSATTDGTAMAPSSVAAAGANQPHNNMMPFLALNYCIALQGVFPQRP